MARPRPDKKPEATEQLQRGLRALPEGTFSGSSRQSLEAQAILLQAASTFTNLGVDRIQCGYFLTMYGAGPVAAVLDEKLRPIAEGTA